MRLVIVSHTPHYRADGGIVGWGPTVREIDQLSSLFETTVHIAPLHPGPPPKSASRYESSTVELKPVLPSGGESIFAKLAIPSYWLRYGWLIWREARESDVLHVRCPANISLLATLLMPMMRPHHARWIKYAGNWRPDAHDPLSFRFQRWWLRRAWHGAQVTVNGYWEDEPPHIRAFLNPCLTDSELEEGARSAQNRHFELPIRLLYIGACEPGKGADRSIEILSEVLRRGVDARLDIVGDGRSLSALKERARTLELLDRCVFHGWVPRAELPAHLQAAHILIVPSDSEGWPKVISEGMAYGVVPIASDVGSVGQVLRMCGIGAAISGQDIQAFSTVVQQYAGDPASWERESRSGVESTPMFGYSAYVEKVRALLNISSEGSLETAVTQ